MKTLFATYSSRISTNGRHAIVRALALVFIVYAAPFSMGAGAQTLVDVEQKISDAKFEMTAACAIAWQSQSYEEAMASELAAQRLSLYARDWGWRGWWVRSQRQIFRPFDERAAVKRARLTYDNIAGFSIPEGIQIPAAAQGFVAKCRDKLEKPYRAFWQLELLQARRQEKQSYKLASQPNVRRPVSRPSVTSIEITTYETNETSPYDVSEIPCITCPD